MGWRSMWMRRWGDFIRGGCCEDRFTESRPLAAAALHSHSTSHPLVILTAMSTAEASVTRRSLTSVMTFMLAATRCVRVCDGHRWLRSECYLLACWVAVLQSGVIR